jgi:hypothetical protein
MYLPMATPPVKVIRSTAGFVSSSSAISRGSPVTTLSISGGRPASYRMSANSRADSGTFSRRLEHHAVVGGHAGHHLVRHLVHRVVERA